MRSYHPRRYGNRKYSVTNYLNLSEERIIIVIAGSNCQLAILSEYLLLYLRGHLHVRSQKTRARRLRLDREPPSWRHGSQPSPKRLIQRRQSRRSLLMG